MRCMREVPHLWQAFNALRCQSRGCQAHGLCLPSQLLHSVHTPPCAVNSNGKKRQEALVFREFVLSGLPLVFLSSGLRWLGTA